MAQHDTGTDRWPHLDDPPLPSDRPAGEDPAYALALRQITRGLRTAAATGLVWVIAAWPLARLPWSLTTLPITRIVAALALALGLVVLASALAAAARLAPWIGAARRLGRTEPWREVSATLFADARGHHIRCAEADGSTTTLSVLLTTVVAEAVAGAGRVAIIGPDASGRAVLRRGPLHALIPAKVASGEGRLTPVRGRRPEPGGPASADVVALRWARHARERTGRALLPLVTVFFVGCAVGLAVWSQARRRWIVAGADPDGYSSSVYAAVTGLVWLVVLTVVAVARWQRYREWWAAPALLAEGPWTRLPVTLTRPFRPNRRGLGAATATVTLPDGARLPVFLRDANIDVIGYVQATGSLWFAGVPLPGRPAAVGVPGHPILGVAHPDQVVSAQQGENPPCHSRTGRRMQVCRESRSERH